MTTDIVVLGAGMVGVATALALQQRGHAVTLVDRKMPGRETSYGNAGLIQREAVEPYAFPRDVATLLRVAAGRGNDVHYHADALWPLLPRLARYWYHSAPARHAVVSQAYERLIAHCLGEHAALMAPADAEDLVQKRGWRQAYRSQAAFDAAAAAARTLAQRHGLATELLDSAALARAEPALHAPMAGAIHWQDPWSVNDPGELVARYARLFLQRGGRFVHGDAMTLRTYGNGWSVASGDGSVAAAHAVVALGPWAGALTQRLGYRLPLFVKRGYHRHYATDVRLEVPMLDAERGVALSPMSRGLRIATGAEFARHDAPATPVQLMRAEHSTRELLALGAPLEDLPWLGARPCTVDMKPVIGPAPRHPGLWFNFGHAHQGFTLGPATGRLLAEMLHGETPYIDPAPYLPSRFGA
ncbi:FAD-binding oxidoreductase [soil metagenome]